MGNFGRCGSGCGLEIRIVCQSKVCSPHLDDRPWCRQDGKCCRGEKHTFHFVFRQDSVRAFLGTLGSCPPLKLLHHRGQTFRGRLLDGIQLGPERSPDCQQPRHSLFALIKRRCNTMLPPLLASSMELRGMNGHDEVGGVEKKLPGGAPRGGGVNLAPRRPKPRLIEGDALAWSVAGRRAGRFQIA